MSRLTVELPEPLSQKVQASGLSYQQLGKVMTYLLEMYLKLAQNKKFIQISDKVQQTSHLEDDLSNLDTKSRKLGAGQWKENIWMADDFDELPDNVSCAYLQVKG